jgi:hypothetical protein
MLAIERVRIGGAVGDLVRAQRARNRLQDFLRLARFGQHQRHAARMRELSRLGLHERGRVEHDMGTRDVAVGAQLPDEFIAIHARHQDVADHQLGPFGTCKRERLGTVGGFDEAMPRIAEQGGYEIAIR